ncbi:hypothetical protein [Caulobacter sp. UC70_42]|uniref:hypothetical protein n=1 Tax=Caulobacter sp. UC70_42 TaxID=3374551 RepID=UPI00375646BF
MSKPQSRLPPTTKPKQDIAFVFRSYQGLRQQLGDIDSLAAAIVIATRDLRAAALGEANEQYHLVDRAAVHGVSTRYVDFQRLEPRTVQLLLVGVFQQVEAFLEEIREEQKLFGRTLPDKRDGETVFDYALRSLPGGTLANQQRLGKERIDLLDYYRLVRNAFAHSGDEQRLARAFADVEVHQALVEKEYGLKAPNTAEALTHDDYLLATRLTKYLATDICRIAGPNGAPEIIGMMVNGEFNDDPIAVIAKRRTNEPRARKAISLWLYSHFVYDVGDHPGVLDAIMTWSATLPTWRERHRARRKAEGRI